MDPSFAPPRPEQPYLAPASIGLEAFLRRLGPETPRRVVDALHAQLVELVETRAPARKLSRSEVERAVVDHLGGTPLGEYGNFVYFPWSGDVVRILPEDEYREVRTSRNCNKITAQEQERLGALRIAVVGLSVGRASAVTLALEGIGRHFRLADFDEISLSNMNRLQVGVHDVGLNKAVSCARELYEIDPYLQVQTFTEGVTDATMDAILGSGERAVDLLVEECDEIRVKLELRAEARRRRIPVVMETSDRGMLDVERFDLEPDRPIFHGLVGDLDPDALSGMSNYEKVPLILRLIGAETMSDRMAASLVDIDTTLRTWPQLASAIAVGGALNAVAARKIALGTWTSSGRYYVDVESQLGDGREVRLVPAGPGEPEGPAPAPRLPAARAPAADGEVHEDAVRDLVAYAAAAPSGGNCQPWAFRWQPCGPGGDLECHHDPTRSRSVLDYGDRASFLALGAAAENLVLAAQASGIRAEWTAHAGEDGRAWSARLSAGSEAVHDPLAAQIGVRTTNRKRGRRVPLTAAAAGRMQEAAGSRGGRLDLVQDEAGLEVLGEVLARGDRLRFLSPDLHREMFAELRFPPEPAQVGLDVRTLELDPTQRAGLAVTRRADALAAMRAMGTGEGLGKAARDAVAASSAVAVLRFPGAGTRADCVLAGRALQRAWLQATADGLAVQPWAPLLYLWMRLDAGGDGLDAWQVAELEELRRRYREVVPAVSGATDVFLYRITEAGPPSARSLRLPVAEVFSIGRPVGRVAASRS